MPRLVLRSLYDMMAMDYHPVPTAAQGTTNQGVLDVLPRLPKHMGEYTVSPLKNHTALGPDRHVLPWDLETRIVANPFDDTNHQASAPCTELILSRRYRNAPTFPTQAVVRVSADMERMVVRVPIDAGSWEEIEVRRNQRGDTWAFEMDLLGARERFEWRLTTPAASPAVRHLHKSMFGDLGRCAKNTYARFVGGVEVRTGWELVRTTPGRTMHILAAVAGDYITPRKCRKFKFRSAAMNLGKRFHLIAYMASHGVTMVEREVKE